MTELIFLSFLIQWQNSYSCLSLHNDRTYIPVFPYTMTELVFLSFLTQWQNSYFRLSLHNDLYSCLSLHNDRTRISIFPYTMTEGYVPDVCVWLKVSSPTAQQEQHGGFQKICSHAISLGQQPVTQILQRLAFSNLHYVTNLWEPTNYITSFLSIKGSNAYDSFMSSTWVITL